MSLAMEKKLSHDLCRLCFYSLDDNCKSQK